MKTSFLNRSYYRFELLFDALRAIIIVFVLTAIWREIYKNQDSIDGYTLSQMVVYTCSATLLTLLFNVQIAMYVAEKVRRGDIAVEFIKPINCFLFWFSDNLGSVLYQLCIGVLPALITLSLLFDLSAVLSAHWIQAIVFSFFGFLLYYLFCYLCALSTFFTVDAWGIEFFRINIIRFFAGGFIPITLFPGWLGKLSDGLPFQYMIYPAAATLSGRYPHEFFVKTIVMQCLWIAIVWMIGQLIWQVVMRKVTIHGG